MDSGTILLIILVILGVMFTTIMVYLVIARGRERSIRDAADRFSEGIRRLRAREYDAAVREFSETIAFDPGHWTSYFRRGEAYRNLGLEEQARDDFENAEFLMEAVQYRGEVEEVAPFTPPKILISFIFGSVIGGLVGGFIGAILGFFYFSIFTGTAGAFLGGAFGGTLGSALADKAVGTGVGLGCGGCFSGGCLGVVAAWLILLVTLGIFALIN
ncbi:MAG: hypothetical protein IH872_05445 [Chloroflexi bacterium]|nr:hypothetical protein [Chloroflexota bacterium]